MVQGKWYPMGGDIAQPLLIRQAVFSRGQDALDELSWQVAVFRDDAPVGSARLWWLNGAFMLGDVGVLETQRHQGYGDLLVRLLLYKALTHNAELIALDAPEALTGFFAHYGFKPEKSEGGLVHMTLAGKDVQLSHCGGNCEGCQHRGPECAPKALR